MVGLSVKQNDKPGRLFIFHYAFVFAAGLSSSLGFSAIPAENRNLAYCEFCVKLLTEHHKSFTTTEPQLFFICCFLFGEMNVVKLTNISFSIGPTERTQWYVLCL